MQGRARRRSARSIARSHPARARAKPGLEDQMALGSLMGRGRATGVGFARGVTSSAQRRCGGTISRRFKSTVRTAARWKRVRRARGCRRRLGTSCTLPKPSVLRLQHPDARIARDRAILQLEHLPTPSAHREVGSLELWKRCLEERERAEGARKPVPVPVLVLMRAPVPVLVLMREPVLVPALMPALVSGRSAWPD